jgi:hypothetical protein
MRTYLMSFLVALSLVACGGGNQSSSTGASVTAQATTDTVSACNSSSSFGGTGPLLTDTTNPTLEACKAAITITCNASATFGGTEPLLTDTASPSIKTCVAVIKELNLNDPNGAKALVGQAKIAYFTSDYPLPTGNYLTTCINTILYKGNLSATCRAENGLMVNTVFENAKRCGDIENINGVLACPYG